MNGKIRNIDIDALKGCAIITVVIGHTIQFVYDPFSFDDNILYRLIYSFHMPLFMFISGYLAYYGKGSREWLQRRIWGLVIPFLTWFFIGYFIMRLQGSNENIVWRVHAIVLNPSNNALWFLWILFLESCIYAFVLYIYRIIMKKYGGFIRHSTYVLILLMALIYFVLLILTLQFGNIGGVRLVSVHLKYYFMGVLYSELNSKQECVEKRYSCKKLLVAVCALVLYCLMFPKWHRTEILFIDCSNNDLFGNDIVKDIVQQSYKFVTALCMITFLWVVNSMTSVNKMKMCLAALGTYTIEIYAVHWYFLNDYTRNKVFDAILSLALGIAGPLLIGRIIARNNALTRVCFGKMKKS